MTLVSSQLLKQMLFLAGYSISLAPEIPEIKHKGAPFRGWKLCIYPGEAVTFPCCCQCEAPLRQRPVSTMKPENCPWDKVLSGNQLTE